ncbi:LytTR family DNA-binding domain-containing protein [Desulfospira joergensenii]|uniref:LytTR family DNA-binding domain-containing protein n=1 Tax=Desulfospira joergensenii TaxID=53329 RepID=UPI001377ED07|nr:LytTR family DNA-binding domain-containing protein [Desulfospira joergensenii]
MVGIAYSIAFGGAAILICEAGLAVVLKFDGQKKTITILQAFGVSFGIFVTGFFLLGGIQAGLKPYELPFLAYYYEADTPFSAFSILFFLKMLPVWVLDTILAIMALKLWDEYGKSLMRIRSKRHARSQKICLFENKKKFVFEQTAITHISIQEHYASVYFKNQNQLEKKQIKMSLAKILECVGDESFIRIHRSHAVNVSHVTELTKISGVDQVKIENTNICLPVSRRNLPMVRKKLVYG